MTAQLTDTYRYKGHNYSVIAMTSPIDFDPEEYGFQPKAPTTACWRGYVCHYDITGEQLYLQKLEIYCGDNHYPEFDGVWPQRSRNSEEKMRIYKNLNHKIDYTGSIVVGIGFLQQYYLHMGFQRAWAYRNVYELVFENGKVVKKINHSKVVEQLRQQIDNDPDFTSKLYNDIINFVEDSFSLDKDVKAWWI